MNNDTIIQFSSEELMAGFQNLENHTFFKLFMSEIRERYERAIASLMQESNTENLHALRGMLAAYKTVMNTPTIIIHQVRVEEAKKQTAPQSENNE